MENITVINGPRFSTEIVFIPGSTALILLCNRTSFISWLRNRSIAARSPRLNVMSGGIYQCLSELSRVLQDVTDATDFTGEPGSNVYILTQGMYVHVHADLYA